MAVLVEHSCFRHSPIRVPPFQSTDLRPLARSSASSGAGGGERARDAGQPSAEAEDLPAPVARGGRHGRSTASAARVVRHRAGDVEHEDEPCRAGGVDAHGGAARVVRRRCGTSGGACVAGRERPRVRVRAAGFAASEQSGGAAAGAARPAASSSVEHLAKLFWRNSSTELAASASSSSIDDVGAGRARGRALSRAAEEVRGRRGRRREFCSRRPHERRAAGPVEVVR